mmetsp:Transcript_42282/g.83649  ORF Transcript_42282/g.83649 Transcript_42282/m.83649 type:complete len:648 (+) Transcript_42282:65-2008(+)
MLRQAQTAKQNTPNTSFGKDDMSTAEETSVSSGTVDLEELRNEQCMLREFISDWCSRQEQRYYALEQGHVFRQPKGPQQQPSHDEQGSQQSHCPPHPQWNPPKFVANGFQQSQQTQGASQVLGLSSDQVGQGISHGEAVKLSPQQPALLDEGTSECPGVAMVYRSEMSCPSHWDRAETDESLQHRQQWTNHLKHQVSKELRRQSSKRRIGIEPSPCLVSLVENWLVQTTCAVVILANAAFIGYTSDVAMKLLLQEEESGHDPAWWRHFNTAFTCFYAVEISLRVAAYRWSFVTGEDKNWNALDTVLLVFAVMEASAGNDRGGTSTMRVLKGLRMFRVLRVIRVLRFFRDLRLMVCSIMQSLGSLCWAMLLLLVIMFLFTTLFMQGIIIYLNDNPGDINHLREGSKTWYGSIWTTMYTLLAAITGGIDWQEAVVPLDHISELYRGVWSFYVMFVVLGVLNVLTGIFVERACELSGLDRDLVVQSEMKRNESFLVEMKCIFEEADEDRSGTITWQEFKKYMENPRIQAYFATKQLDAFDARSLFELFSQDHAEEIGIEEFVIGCQRLKGMARSVDLLAVLREARETKRVMKALLRRIDPNMDATIKGDLLGFQRSFTALASEGSEATTIHQQCVSRPVQSSPMKVQCDI